MAAKKKKTAVPKLDAIDQAVAALPKEAIQRLAYDPLDAKKAIRTGLKALEKYVAQLKRLYPGFDLVSLKLLPDACDRLLAAQRKVNQAGSAKNIAQLTELAFSRRRALLAFAQSLGELGLVDAKELAKIERGKGRTDNLQDVVDLVALLTPHEARVDAALERGVLAAAKKAALEALAAHGDGEDDSSSLIENRDRLATFISRGHARIRLALAVVTTLEEAMDRVPPLRSARPAEKPETVPSPA